MAVLDAAAFGVPAAYNAASHLVDRHLDEGRGAKTALECGDERVTYAELAARVNQLGRALRDRLGVGLEDRVALLLFDGPHFFYSFFGANKIGAVPIPVNTLWTPSDYAYVLADSGARVVIVSAELAPRLAAIGAEQWSALEVEHVVIVGTPTVTFECGARVWDWTDLVSGVAADLDAAPTSRDDPAFWLYSSGSTGRPKGCVHLQHDMLVCAELFAKGILGSARERSLLQRAEAVLRVRPRQRAATSRWPSAARSILWPGRADGRERLCGDRTPPADAVLLGADRIRHASRA